ncbi:2-dehydropantoate 2-reductase [Pseudonocardia thermophila]|jgi:Ketopantoate reductase|uniref:2-dehydropantoate 2-reductase n=1 Tax=Pseudonocardia thermophila TaxID=1848 RepID=A0A1M6N4Y1_PSETH|nr:2-dehydropantoate 2-reductase N-terminal domain-containing protein [Pseudonocardia thermophila]SHJ90663.1 2-dehydropantoate 2-reductase [Pseudonocardia thermophila]
MARVAVLGAGAVGGMLGALLAKAGHEVVVLGSDRTTAAIAVHGLSLASDTYGEITAAVEARSWLVEPPDVLVVATKAPDLAAALLRAPAAVVGRATVVPLLNGVDHVAYLRGVYPEAEVVPMTVSVEATRTAPGVIEHLSPFASYATAGETEPGVLLAEAGLDVDTSAADEATLLWRKLAFLAPVALLTTATQAPIGPAREARPSELAALVDEACAAAAEWGARIDPDAVRARIAGVPASMRSSMLKDRVAGATLELDAIAGPILRALPGKAPATKSAVAAILG